MNCAHLRQLLCQPVQHLAARQHLGHAGVRLAPPPIAAKNSRSGISMPFIDTSPWLMSIFSSLPVNRLSERAIQVPVSPV